MWTNIRNNYRKAMKNRISKSGDSAKPERPIKHERELQFLNTFLQNRAQVSNLDSSSEETQDSFLDSPQSRPQSQMSHSDSQKLRPRSQNITTAEILKEYIDTKNNEDEHPIDLFFKSMAATVKSLPKKLQLQVKRDVLLLVNKAEIEYSELSEAPQNIETTRSIYEPSTSKQNPPVNKSNYTMDDFSYYPPQATSVNNEDNIQSTLTYTPTPILRCQDDNIETSDYQNIETNVHQHL